MTVATERDDRRQASHVIHVGVVVFVLSAAIVLLPLVIGRSPLNKYLVAFGLVGSFVGLGCFTNGLIDLIRARNR